MSSQTAFRLSPAEEESRPFIEFLSRYVRKGAPELQETLPDNQFRCLACGHRCLIREGRLGICKVRFNQGGTLLVPFNYVTSLQCDPVEKKPFFHALPGSSALSFGMLGCDMKCGYCQNWVTSQAIRDPGALTPITPTTAEELVSLAVRYKAPILASTYNEPLITSEWAVEVFRLARRQGLKTAYISNGNGTPQVLSYLRPFVDLYKVDLKSFSDAQYRRLGAQLPTILETIERLVTMGFWVEVVTLIVPGFNDSEKEIAQIADFLVSISPDIPWHVTAFHPDYKMREYDSTLASTVVKAAEVGYQKGLRYVYAGNLPGQVGPYENTYCPACKTLLIKRWGFKILQNSLHSGTCPTCAIPIPGIWT